jgi:hypothetical protein
MVLRLPDKPNEVFASNPKIWDEFKVQQWIATQKLDGFRLLIVKDFTYKIIKGFGSINWARGKNKDLFFLSRRGTNKGGPTNIPVCEEIVKQVESMDLPDQSMLDSEWLERRTKDDGIHECVFLLDYMWRADDWLGNEPHKDRITWLNNIKIDDDWIRRPNFVTENYVEFYEKQKAISWTEGIVLKHVNSIIIGDDVECKKNPLWCKVKWRSGSNGREEVKIF